VRAGVRSRYLVRATDPFPGGRIVRYVWHWGDGQVTHTTHASVSHRYRAAGEVTVRVKAVDNFGRSRIVNHNLRVRG